MISSNNIHPPKNWQDFEMLCLKLWGEIWNIPNEIDFNSDNSQGQQGVDIYGPVDGGLKYNGIQCKNKKLNLIDGSRNRITTSDIKIEIDKAKEFKPTLNKLIIATSLPKDQKIEEYIRIQSVENIKLGLFSIQICFWDFFERKLPEFPKLYNWYLKNENFHRISSAKVVFSDGSTEQTYYPRFQKIVDDYILKPEEKEIDNTSILLGGNVSLTKFLELASHSQMLSRPIVHEKFDWHQEHWFNLRIINSGKTVIEDFKLELDFEGDFIKVGRESRSGIFAQHFTTDIYLYSNTKRALYVKPTEKILVQGNSYTSDDIYLKPTLAVQTEITICWKLLARDFEDNGKLTIKIEPIYHRVLNTHHVETKEEVRKETSYRLIQRPGDRDVFRGGINFLDKDSDYS